MVSRTLGKSRVVFELIEGDCSFLPGLEVNEVQYEGESAESEVEGIGAEGLVEKIVEMTDPPLRWRRGWWLTEDFQAHAHQHYDGEHDCTYDLGRVRRASVWDRIELGVGPAWLTALDKLACRIFHRRHHVLEDVEAVREHKLIYLYRCARCQYYHKVRT